MFLSDAPVYSASFLKTACVSSSVRGRMMTIGCFEVRNSDEFGYKEERRLDGPDGSKEENVWLQKFFRAIRKCPIRAFAGGALLP